MKNDILTHETILSFIKELEQNPAITQRNLALKLKISLGKINYFLNCLADGYPFVFGFTVYESFETEKVKRTGIVPMPKKNERPVGGHAVLAVGYNQKQKRFLVRNSWGKAWGKDGYFTMPYEYLETQAADFWTIRK